MGSSCASPCRCGRVEQETPGNILVRLYLMEIILATQVKRLDNRSLHLLTKLRGFCTMQLNEVEFSLFYYVMNECHILVDEDADNIRCRLSLCCLSKTFACLEY